jgi:hypothetical protein
MLRVRARRSKATIITTFADPERNTMTERSQAGDPSSD